MRLHTKTNSGMDIPTRPNVRSWILDFGFWILDCEIQQFAGK